MPRAFYGIDARSTGCGCRAGSSRRSAGCGRAARLAFPGALHTGYGWVQVGHGAGALGLPLWVVLVLPFAKILATSLSIGSGGSGGIFGPGMVIGGMLGAAVLAARHGRRCRAFRATRRRS